MGPLLHILGVFAVLFAFIGLLWLVAWQLGLLKGRGGTGELPYCARRAVLTPGEQAFLPVLQQAVQVLAAARRLPPPLVLASVRYAEVLEVDLDRRANPSAWQRAQNRITSKQADFVVCHPETTRPLLIVELDDRSHQRGDRVDRDGFVDRACESAGVPILHVRAAARYDAQSLARDIGELLASKG